MLEIKLPDDKILAKRVLEVQAEHAGKELEMGRVGSWLGSATEKPGNVAGIAIILSFLMLLIVFLVPVNATAPRDSLFTLFGGIITLALGYLFGKSDKSK